jgi:putative SOS response-associated peptidase YedK
MCGRFSLYEPSDRVARFFAVDEVAPGEPDARFNVAPSQLVFSVVCSRDGERRRLGTLRWGLVPGWAKDPSIGNRLINARAETVADAPSFRRAFERRRCLVPVNGFFEWWHDPEATRRRGRPFFVRPPDQALLALGGVWEVWHGPDDQVLRTVAIVTTMANAEVSAIHDRMPVIVEADDWARWLAPEALKRAEAGRLLRPSPAGRLQLVEVADLVNNPRNDRPETIEAVGPAT